MIKVGYMGYANIFPIFYHLEKNPNYEFIKGVPSELNEALRRGELDVSPVSSLEYLNQSHRYRILSGVGICAKGPVESVLLCSQYPIQELCRKKIYLTADSLTSSNLVDLILERFLNSSPRYVLEGEDFDACLLIGDKALYVYHNERPYYTYDLSDIWFKFTNLPFVFSLWLAAEQSSNKPEVKELHQELKEIVPQIRNNLEIYADDYVSRNPGMFTKEQLISYWHKIYYDIKEEEMSGFNHFLKMLGYEPKWYYLNEEI